MYYTKIINYLINNYNIIINDYYAKTYLIQCKNCKNNNLKIDKCNCYNYKVNIENITEVNKYNNLIECKKYNSIKLLPKKYNNINEHLLNIELCNELLKKYLN